MDEAKREAIEKAVVELGEWNSKHDCLYQNIFNKRYDFADGNGRYHSGGITWELADKSWRMICTSAEFEQVKAEMQNKPSWGDAPDWAKWLGQCSSGHWEWYEDKPSHNGSYWTHGESKGQGSQHGEVIGDWRNTLEKRPEQAEQPMKYQYGVEYECDGVKPDLDDDVLVDAYGLYSQDWHNKEKPVSDWPWDNFEKFRIVDERYKPNLDELSEREPTPELRELMRGSWHERGDFPPVGERCRCNTMDYGWQECDVLSDDNINGFDVMVCRIEPDGCLQYVAAHEFKPLRTEEDELLEQAHIDSENDEWLFSKRELVRRLIRKGWRPPKN